MTRTAQIAPPKGRWLYALARSIVVAFDKLFWRVTVDGKEHVPAKEPFILAPVHRSNIDTPLVATVTSRRLRYMGKQEMWKVKPIGWLFSALGSFPVDRGHADREALRRCIEVLEAGEPLVVFPEGTRRFGPVVEDLFEGAAYIASRADVAIIPVGIGGSEAAMPKGARFLKPVKVHLVVGPPLRAERSETGRVPRSAVHDLTVRLQAELQRLFDEAQKQVGRPNALPPAGTPT
ncbi:MAG TPA: lysophospholipid acyltransferase family protein [Acidimicrobiales bacterium]|nr:lysophospholipid acyltransferase family protein [Acidimicrobiales bacterium]